MLFHNYINNSDLFNESINQVHKTDLNNSLFSKMVDSVHKTGLMIIQIWFGQFNLKKKVRMIQIFLINCFIQFSN